MLFITALKNIKRNLIASIFEILQITAILITALVMVSSVLIRYRLYTPFKDYFRENGIFAYYLVSADENPSMPSYDTIIDDKDILNRLEGATNIISCHSVFAGLTEHPEDAIKTISYDDEIIKKYSPEISEGRWFDLNSDELETVISENDYKYKVGDYIDFDFYNNKGGTKFKIKIVGKIKDGTKIPGYYINVNKSDYNFNNFYYSYYYEVEKSPLFLFSYSQLKNLSSENQILQPVTYAALIKYNHELSSKEFKTESEKLSSYGDSVYCNMIDLNKNSKNYLYNQVYNLMPIIICLVLFVFITNICNNALSTRRRLKDYAIFYINGLRWNQCALINLYESLIISIISIICAVIVIFAVQFTQFAENIKIIWSWIGFLTCFAVMTLYILTSMLMPFIIIRQNTPKEILTR